jgi:hypothetical protein
MDSNGTTKLVWIVFPLRCIMHTNVLDSDGFVIDRDALDSWCFATEHSPVPIMHMLVPDAPTDPPHTVLPISVLPSLVVYVKPVFIPSTKTT